MRDIGRQSIHKLWSSSFINVCFINLALFCGFHMINSSMAFFVLELGGDEAMAGLAAGLYSISAVLMRPVVGWTLDNKGRRGTMLFRAFRADLRFLRVCIFQLYFISNAASGPAGPHLGWWQYRYQYNSL